LQGKKILIVVAHPDDEVLGCGGFIHKYSKTNEIYSVILSGKVEAREKRPELEELLENINKANSILGIKKTFLGKFPNIKFNNVAHLEMVKFIEKTIIEVQPEIILTHHPNDLNNDHYQVSQACQAASSLYLRRKDLSPIEFLAFMEILSSTEWSYSNTNSTYQPNTFIELSEIDIDMKIKALNSYKDVMRPWPHSRSAEVLKSHSIYRGAQFGVKFAETLQTIFQKA